MADQLNRDAKDLQLQKEAAVTRLSETLTTDIPLTSKMK